MQHKLIIAELFMEYKLSTRQTEVHNKIKELAHTQCYNNWYNTLPLCNPDIALHTVRVAAATPDRQKARMH